MAVNKVVYGNRTLIDISDSTVTANDLRKGVIAYTKSGDRIVGILDDVTTENVTNDFNLTSSYTIRYSRAYRSGNTIELFLVINNGGNAFPNNRFILASFSNAEYWPLYALGVTENASTGINNILNRNANCLLAANGTIYVDKIDSDALEITAHFVYLIQSI